MNNNVRIRRILAWVIDWNLSGLPCMLYSTLFMDVFRRPSVQNMVYILIMLLLIILYPVTFIFRDLICLTDRMGRQSDDFCSNTGFKT